MVVPAAAAVCRVCRTPAAATCPAEGRTARRGDARSALLSLPLPLPPPAPWSRATPAAAVALATTTFAAAVTAAFGTTLPFALAAAFGAFCVNDPERRV